MTRRRGPRTAHGARAPSITWRRARRRGPGRPKGAGAAKIPWDARGFRARESSGGEFTVSPPGAWKTLWDARGFSGETARRRDARSAAWEGRASQSRGPRHMSRVTQGGGNAPCAPKARPGGGKEGGPVGKSLCVQRDFRAGKTRGGEFTVPTGDAWKTLCAIKDFFEEKRFWLPPTLDIRPRRVL